MQYSHNLPKYKAKLMMKLEKNLTFAMHLCWDVKLHLWQPVLPSNGTDVVYIYRSTYSKKKIHDNIVQLSKQFFLTHSALCCVVSLFHKSLLPEQATCH